MRSHGRFIAFPILLLPLLVCVSLYLCVAAVDATYLRLHAADATYRHAVVPIGMLWVLWVGRCCKEELCTLSLNNIHEHMFPVHSAIEPHNSPLQLGAEQPCSHAAVLRLSGGCFASTTTLSPPPFSHLFFPLPLPYHVSIGPARLHPVSTSSHVLSQWYALTCALWKSCLMCPL